MIFLINESHRPFLKSLLKEDISNDIIPLSEQDFEKNGGYVISSGGMNKLYTLRLNKLEYNREEDLFTRSYYLQNLGKDWDEVVIRLPEILKKYTTLPVKIYIPGWVSGKLDPNKPPNIGQPVTQFWFGKHMSETIDEVYNTDKNYLLWVASTFVPGKNPARNVFFEQIQDKVAPELKEYLNQKELESQNITQQQILLQKQLDPIVKILETTWINQYYPWVIENFKKGDINLPPKVKYQVLEAYGKTFGRVNSKAYNKAYEELKTILE